ncbi:MAG: hypothetical protein HFI19_08125 [Lachnospiraceae bacterium]|jgi:hypothetical protein|uniref:DUF6756 family protein n=1 Tax=Candidatus Merdisoma sp. JLR.KK006 TaxID=3112626 RepID=UPI002FF20416|nr:hypothetical protein [Lachnospiraceae bacterium]
MFKIGTHICDELKNSEMKIKKLGLNERKEVLDSVLKKYIDINKKGAWIWEKFIHYKTLNDDMAWSYIKDFVKHNECVMFFNQAEEKEMFLVQSGEDLNYILSETYGFEFYITDKQYSYLLCFNHHNILYGCGVAEEWINTIRGNIDSE